jgi:hypothetical protein
MSHAKFESLRKAILDKAKNGMEIGVLPQLKKQMKLSVEQEVYAVYTPLSYRRRKGSSGGLASESVMKGYIHNEREDGFHYLFQNEAQAKYGTGGITPLIVKGQDWALATNYRVKHMVFPSIDTMYINHSGSKFTPFYEPRDFITHTKENLKKADLSKKLNEYMQ